ncbi:MAG: serine/threonine-protein phosphatase [Candidatus Riflebacteria bacterium]|nr:serine/threonine-protein phosphatase [Candidatus Riflebacteria bacterium]
MTEEKRTSALWIVAAGVLFILFSLFLTSYNFFATVIGIFLMLYAFWSLYTGGGDLEKKSPQLCEGISLAEEIEERKKQAESDEYLSFLLENSFNGDPNSAIVSLLSKYSAKMEEGTCMFFRVSSSDFAFVTAYEADGRNGVRSLSKNDPAVNDLLLKIANLETATELKRKFIEPIDFITSDIASVLIPCRSDNETFGILGLVCPAETWQAISLSVSYIASSLGLFLRKEEVSSQYAILRESMAATEVKGELLLGYSLPEIPRFSQWEIARSIYYSPVYSGDFHQFAVSSENKLFVLLGSASCEGLKAAMFLTQFLNISKIFALDAKSPADLLNRLSDIMIKGAFKEYFINITVLSLDLGEKRVIEVVSAGQNPPLIHRKAMGFAMPANLDTSVPLGLLEPGDNYYKDTLIELLPGDGLLLYTNGVTVPSESGKIGEEEVKIALGDSEGASGDTVLNTFLLNLKGKNSDDSADIDSSYIYLRQVL